MNQLKKNKMGLIYIYILQPKTVVQLVQECISLSTDSDA